MSEKTFTRLQFGYKLRLTRFAEIFNVIRTLKKFFFQFCALRGGDAKVYSNISNRTNILVMEHLEDFFQNRNIDKENIFL